MTETEPHSDHPQPDPEQHERTFEAFMRFSAWVAIGGIVVLIFLALANA